MIQFNDIKLHDLVYLDSEGIVPGWFLVTGVSQKVGFFTATQLGYDIRPVMVPSDRMGIVQKHIRAAAVPGAIEALERIEMTAGQPAMDDDPVRVRALRRYPDCAFYELFVHYALKISKKARRGILKMKKPSVQGRLGKVSK